MTDYRPDPRRPENAPGRKRTSAFMRVLGSLIGWGLLFGLALLALGTWGFFKVTSPGPLTKDVVVELPKGASRAEIATLLQESGVISDSRMFSAAAALKSLRGSSLKPGEYKFTTGATMQDVLALVNSGRVLTYKITIPEGWTTDMALARIRENDVLAGDIASVPAEGAVMADTVEFRRGDARQSIVDRLAAAQAKLVDTLWAERPAGTILKTKEELLTLASIVEKETGKADERPLVAAVFINRLKNHMRLQSDPTIIYGLVAGKGKLERALTRADIDQATPYNTYQIDGLPPGPIGTPGKAALEAVLNPSPVPYLYFVADGTGGHAFATTLDEHNKNVSKWRKIENGTAPAQTAPVEQPAPAPAPAVVEPQKATGLGNVELAPSATTAAAPAAAAPVEQQAAPVVATPAAEDTTAPLDVKPGSIIHMDGKLVPIPAPAPKR